MVAQHVVVVAVDKEGALHASVIELRNGALREVCKTIVECQCDRVRLGALVDGHPLLHIRAHGSRYLALLEMIG